MKLIPINRGSVATPISTERTNMWYSIVKIKNWELEEVRNTIKDNVIETVFGLTQFNNKMKI